MLFRKLIFSFFLGFFALSSMAGSGHDHGHSHHHDPVDQLTAGKNASNIVADFVKRKKLAPSWSSIAAKSVEKIDFKGVSEWRIIFVNDAVTDSAKRTLYVFLTLGGEYIAVNYTGN